MNRDEIRALNERSAATRHLHPELSAQLAKDALAAARAAGDKSGELYALINEAFHLLRAGNTDAARAQYGAALALATAQGDARARWLTEEGMASADWLTGKYAEARERLTAVERAPENERTAADRISTFNTLGLCCKQLGEPENALAYLYRAREMARVHGEHVLEAAALANIGATQLDLDNPEDALPEVEAGLKLSRELRSRRWEFNNALNRILALVWLDRVPEARQALDELQGDDALMAAGSREHLSFTQALVGFRTLALDQAQAALDRLSEGGFASRPAAALAHSWLQGRLWLAQNKLHETVGLGTAALETAPAGLRMQFDGIQLLEVLSDAHARLGQHEIAYGYMQRYVAAHRHHYAVSKRARVHTLKILHQLHDVERERDIAMARVDAAQREKERLAEANFKLQEEIIETAAREKRLQEENLRDPLTGLFNRRALSEELARAIATATRDGQPLAVVMLDIDHFKSLNDRYGHPFGDQVLQRLARVLGGRVRASDSVYRYGGEEFCVLLPHCSLAQARRRVNEMMEAFRALVFAPEGEELRNLTFSAGVATYPLHATTAAGLIDCADRALYSAKKHGRDRVELFDPLSRTMRTAVIKEPEAEPNDAA